MNVLLSNIFWGYRLSQSIGAIGYRNALVIGYRLSLSLLVLNPGSPNAKFNWLSPWNPNVKCDWTISFWNISGHDSKRWRWSVLDVPTWFLTGNSITWALCWVFWPGYSYPNGMYLAWISLKICMISQDSQCWTCLTFEPLVWAKAFAHVLHDLPLRMENPRFTHTFTDEDGMMLLKKWAKKSDGKDREKVISRLSRMKLKTLKWRLRETQNKRGWMKNCLLILVRWNLVFVG